MNIKDYENKKTENPHILYQTKIHETKVNVYFSAQSIKNMKVHIILEILSHVDLFLKIYLSKSCLHHCSGGRFCNYFEIAILVSIKDMAFNKSV